MIQLNKEEMFNKRLREYINKNIELYNEYEQNFLEGLDLNYLKRYKKNMPDIFRQILEEIGYYEDCIEESGYQAFIDLLDNEFGLEKNIIEVGGGVVPTLGHKISLRQNKGSITIYDPRLSNYFNESEKFVLKREKFYRNTDVSEADVIIGFMPCEATQAIIENAVDKNKDFMIALCEGGPHGDEFDYFEDENEWLKAMLYIAERGLEDNDMGDLKILSFKKYNSPYPIIYNKRNQ